MYTASWAVRTGIAGMACVAFAACSPNKGNGQGGQASGTADSTASQNAATATTSGGEAATTATSAAPMNDANIVALISEANNAEIQAGKMAETKASNSSVKSFAKQMVHDHQQMQAQGDQVAKQANITPQAPANDTLASHAQQEQTQLGSATGADFDRTYINDQVMDHQTVLALLNQAQGQAQNAQLKDLISKAIPKVQSHLDRAQKIQGTLKPSA